MGPEEAEKKQKEPNFLTNVIGKSGDKTVYEMNGSGFYLKTLF